jgi:hypothetical protein
LGFQKGKPYVSYVCRSEVMLSLKILRWSSSYIWDSLYARDHTGETSVEVLINPTELESSEHCARREVFPLSGIIWGDGKNLSHILIIRISRERLYCFWNKLARHMVSTEYDFYIW